jgi:tetratricopeptide (TPR) repeat protein
MRRLTIIIILLAFATSLPATSFNRKGKDKEKDDDKESNISVGLARGWILFNNKDYFGALRVYRSLYKKSPSNAVLNYRMGVCFDATNKKDSAIFHINKALEQDSLVNKKAYYYLGKSSQFNDNLDEAISYYYKYKKLDPKNRTDVNRLLRQCETAKYMQKNPVNAKITNLGPNINSEYVDASPSISADQNTLIFTSRRKENTGGKICISNEQYFDDIYISRWDNKKNEWAKAENIGEPINTDGFDANLSISPDGQKIFIYKNIENQTGSGDIYYSSYNTTNARILALESKNANMALG